MNVFKNHACACAQAPRAGHQSPLAEEQSTGDVSDLPRDEKSNNYWTRNLWRFIEDKDPLETLRDEFFLNNASQFTNSLL